MKKILLSFLVAFLALTTYAQVQIGSQTFTSTGYPVHCWYDYSYSEQIYLQTEINAVGFIDTISFYFDGGGITNNSNDWTIYLAHTSKNEYTGTSDWITSNGMTQVFSGRVSIPASGWFKIGLNTPFLYNNIDNLVLAIDENAPGFDGDGRDWRRSNVTTARTIYSYEDGLNINPLTPLIASGVTANVANVIFGGIQQSCPTLSGINSYDTDATTSNITWLSGANDSVWIIEYDTAGFALGTGNIINATNDSVLLSNLLSNTSYDVYVKGICHVGDSSPWVGPYNFTTECSSALLPYIENFASYLPSCWEEASGSLTNNSNLTYGSSDWTSDGFGNIGFSGSARMEIWSNTKDEWLISPSFDLGSTIPYQVEFDVALTVWNSSATDTLQVDDTLAFLVSTDNGTTWSNSNIIYTWKDGVEPTSTGDHAVFSLGAYTGTVKFAFYAASSVSGEDVNVYIDNFQVREVPACEDPTGLTAYKTTHDSIALTWITGSNDSSWIIQYDTAGFSIGTGTIVNSSNDTLILNPVNELYTYDIYIKGICLGGDSSVWVGPITVSTPSSCPKPTAFTSYFVGVDSVSLKWSAGLNDSVWLIEYGASGFTPGSGTELLSTNDSLVITSLNGASSYDFYLRGICSAGDTGIYVGPISRTTNCPIVFLPPYSQDFVSYPVLCWTEAKGRLLDSTIFTSVTSSSWTQDGFANVGVSGAARINIYNVNQFEWAISPSFDLGNSSTTYQLEFDIALTKFANTNAATLDPDDTVAIVISTDNGLTWSNANNLRIWSEANAPSSTGDRIKIRLTGYTDTVKFGFYAQSLTNDVADNDLFIDNFDLIAAPTCPEADSLTVLSRGADSVQLSWQPGLFDNSWIIEYDTIGFLLGSGTEVSVNNDTTVISGLMPLTTYDFYLRSVCSVGDSSLWIGPLTVSTKADCPAPTTISDFLLARDSNNITWIGDVTDSLYFIEWDTTNFVLGSGNNSVENNDTISITSLVANKTYDFYVRTLCKSLDTSVWVGPYTFTTIESCPVVSLVSEFNTAKDSTNITWLSGQYDSVWLIEYDTTGFPVGSGNMITSTVDSIVLNGLLTNTSYQVYVKSICTSGDTSALIGPFVFTTLESCPNLDSIFSFGTTLDSTNISWVNGNYDSSWIIEYDTSGFVLGSGTIISASNDTVSIGSLLSATKYDVYVKSICSIGDSSNWVGPYSFNTNIINPSLCGLNLTIPDNTCGTVLNEFNIAVTSAPGSQLGVDVVLKEVKLNITHPFISDIDVSLVSPYGDTVELSSDNGGAGVNYGDTINGCAQFTTFNMEAFSFISLGNAPFVGSFIPEGDFNDFNNNLSPIGDWKLLICDDEASDVGALQFVELVFDLPLSCPRIDSIVAFSPGRDSVNLTWQSGANDSIWIIEYGTAGFTVGSGNIITVNNDTAVLSGLNSITTYDVYVRSICSIGDTSIQVGPISFTTLCPAFFIAPWVEEFKTNVLSSCWSESGDNSWEFGSGVTIPLGFADYGANNVSDYSLPGNGTFIGMDGSDNVNGDVSSLLTPLVDVSTLITPALSYAVFSNNINDAAQNKLIVDFYDGAVWHQIDSIQENLGSNWVEKLFDLSSYTITGPVQIKYTITGVSNGVSTFYNDILIDDVKLDEMPTCPKASGLIAYDAGKDSINITWIPGINDSIWNVEYGPIGFVQGTGTIVTATNDSITINNLNADTEYEFYLRSICHVGDSSVWIGPAVDTTLPFCVRVQSFSSLSADTTSINVGWFTDPTHASFIVEYGLKGFVPGTGTILTTPMPNNFIQVTGLMPSTEYDFYIKSVCISGDTSVLEGPYVGLTECSTQPLPWFEGFEQMPVVGAGLVPVCMSIDGNLTSIVGSASFNRGARTDSTYMYATFGGDDWLFTPKFNLNNSGVYEFSFWYNTDGIGGWDSINVSVGSEQAIVDMDTLLFSETSLNNTTYREVKVYYTPLVSGVHSFGVNIQSNSNPWYLSLDDFNVRDTTNVSSVIETGKLSQFKVYPNPNNGEFDILNKGVSLKTNVTIMDVQGRVIYNNNYYFIENGKRKINLNDIQTGVYILQIENEGRIEKHRIVIE